MDILTTMAEQKIREAIARGDLDNLSLKGQPIAREDFSGVPEELRMGYKILKNAGMLPEELQLKGEILTLRDLLECCQEPQERQKLHKKLTEKMLRFNIAMERNFAKPVFRQYETKILGKLGL